MPCKFLKRIAEMCAVREAEAISNFTNSSFTLNQASRMLNFCSKAHADKD